MFKTVITLKDNLDDTTLSNMKKIADKHFDTRIDKLENVSSDKYVLIYQSDKESGYGATLDGNCTLYLEEEFRNNVKSWTWQDTDEDDVEDVLVELAIPVIRPRKIV
ncbi:hypothetical protein HMPREF9630_01324 [Peptoanaerobacter stomatis]|jgi:hypothetical protein|uniref:Uncharacterized protein n=1 Tax=Peptoanaerobacter stomatis TaxID=796937 RepID=V9HR27_9FIRM|nr:hypothetical protein [Peptoanaerobacter stomatis]EHL18068.1 hypothetical protein HMPREF9630_01324 [Peptoanaerobacter stomatis]